MTTTPRISKLLTALSEVEEDMLSLGEDLVLAIRPTDATSIEAGYRSLMGYQDCLTSFREWFQRYRLMISSPDIAELLQVQIAVSSTSQTSLAIPSDTSLQLGQDFSYTKPRRATLAGYFDRSVDTWREVLVITTASLSAKHSDFLARVADYAPLKERGNKPLFTNDQSRLREALQVTEGLFVEGNLSANAIKNVIGHCLDVLCIDRATIRFEIHPRT